MGQVLYIMYNLIIFSKYVYCFDYCTVLYSKYLLKIETCLQIIWFFKKNPIEKYVNFMFTIFAIPIGIMIIREILEHCLHLNEPNILH